MTVKTKEEIVPTANHFDLEIDHFNSAILQDTHVKLKPEDALWNAKTLEAIQKSISISKKSLKSRKSLSTRTRSLTKLSNSNTSSSVKKSRKLNRRHSYNL